MSTPLQTVPRPPAPGSETGKNVIPLYDALRENRIRAVQRLVQPAYDAGHKDEVRRLLAEMTAIAECRSPEQIRRMEDAEMERVPGLRSFIEHQRKQQVREIVA